MPLACGVCPSLMLQKRVREAWKVYETSTARWRVSPMWNWGCLVPRKTMALNTSLGHPTEGNILQNIFLLYQKSVPMEIQMIMVLSHPNAANYTLGLVWWRPAEHPWAQHWVSVGNSKESRVAIWAKPGLCLVLVAVLSGRFWDRGVDSSRSALPRGETRPPAFAFGHLLQVLSFKCCSIM